jgi:ribosomal protein L7/L12
MTTVEIVGWVPGFQKVACTKLLQTHAGLGLAAAKGVTDGILDGRVQIVRLPSESAAESLVCALKSIGASAYSARAL